MSERPMIEAEALQKHYGEHVAVERVDLEVPEARILGVLGPNGAGKSTTVRMLTTMTHPDGGRGRVGGFDVVREADRVRRIIGVTGQDATLDELLTGTQNLVLVGELSKLSRRDAQRRAAELLEHFELTDAAGRMVKTYSGGMRRRLDLAASLMARPPVLFLDEPTTGLDPSSRQRMWDVIRSLVAGGTTVLLTTQYLDEADALADSISVIDHGHGSSPPAPRPSSRRAWAVSRWSSRSRPRARPPSTPSARSWRERSRYPTTGARLKAPVVVREGSRPRSSGGSTTPASRSTTSRSTIPRSTTCSSPSPARRERTPATDAGEDVDNELVEV